MFRCKMKNNFVTRIAQKGCPRGYAFQHPRFSFPAQSGFIDAAQPGGQPNHGLRQVSVQIIRDDMPTAYFRCAGDKRLEILRKVFFRARFANMTKDLAAGHVESGNQRLRAMADIFKFAPLGMAGLHRQPRCDALKRLDSRHFIDGQGSFSFLRALCGGGISGTNIKRFLLSVFIRFRRQPVADEMGLEVSLILKNARQTVEKRSPQCLA